MSSVVCLCAGHNYNCEPWKTAEPIEFEVWSLGAPRNQVLDGVQILMGRGIFFGGGGKCRPIVKYRDTLPWTVQNELIRSFGVWSFECSRVTHENFPRNKLTPWKTTPCNMPFTNITVATCFKKIILHIWLGITWVTVDHSRDHTSIMFCKLLEKHKNKCIMKKKNMSIYLSITFTSHFVYSSHNTIQHKICTKSARSAVKMLTVSGQMLVWKVRF